MYFFKEEQIEIYARRQRQIVMNVLPYLQAGGYLVYITCSVFAAENEDIIAQSGTAGLQLIHQQYLRGYEIKADTLFIAVLRK